MPEKQRNSESDSSLNKVNIFRIYSELLLEIIHIPMINDFGLPISNQKFARKLHNSLLQKSKLYT